MIKIAFLFSMYFIAQAVETDLPVLEDAASPMATNTQNSSSKVISIFEEEEGLLVKKLTTPFVYDRQSRRDPFRLPETTSSEIPLGGIFGPFLELQEVSLEDIKVKAILSDPIKPKAIISYKLGDKERTKKIVIGDYVGENFGVVQAIHDGQVVIVQTFVEGDQKSTTTKTLNIRK